MLALITLDQFKIPLCSLRHNPVKSDCCMDHMDFIFSVKLTLLGYLGFHRYRYRSEVTVCTHLSRQNNSLDQSLSLAGINKFQFNIHIVPLVMLELVLGFMFQ